MHDEGEGLCFGDSVTLFAEKLFGFLQGASAGAEDDDGDDSAVFVRSLEHRHRPSGVLDAEVFQLLTRHDYAAQEALQNFLIQHSLMHPSDIPRLNPEQQMKLQEVQRAAEEEIKQNEERQLFHVGRPLRVGQPFQLLHIQSRLFVTIEAPERPASPQRTASAPATTQALRVRLTEGHSGSHLLINPVGASHRSSSASNTATSTSLNSSISAAAAAASPVLVGERYTLGTAHYGGKMVRGMPPQLVCRRRAGGGGGSKWVVMAFDQDVCLWSLQVLAQAKPALASDSLKCGSMAQVLYILSRVCVCIIYIYIIVAQVHSCVCVFVRVRVCVRERMRVSVSVSVIVSV